MFLGFEHFEENMAKVTQDQIVEIIKKHISDQVFAVVTTGDGMEMISGQLSNVDSKQVAIKDITKGLGATIVPIFSTAPRRVIALYNSQFIDLIRLREPIPLAKKLQGETKKIVIGNMKPHMKNVLYFVSRNGDRLGLSKGKLLDMGLQEFIVSIAPFFNDSLRLNYNSVLNIFTADGEDLTQLPIVGQ